MSNTDQSRRAVLVSVEKDGDDLLIRLDDVTCGAESTKTWTQQEHVTNKLVPGNVFEEMKFDDKELADFGYYILSRLSAFVKRKEN